MSKRIDLICLAFLCLSNIHGDGKGDGGWTQKSIEKAKKKITLPIVPPTFASSFQQCPQMDTVITTCKDCNSSAGIESDNGACFTTGVVAMSCYI